MQKYGLRAGDEAAVIVRYNRKSCGEVTSLVISQTEVSTNVYTEDEVSLIVMYEALKGATEAVRFHLEKPRLRAMLTERIEELSRIDRDEEESEPPSPADDLFVDIPF